MTANRPVPDPVYILRGSANAVTCLRFSGSSAQFLYSGNMDGNIHVWDMKSKRVVQSFIAHDDRSVLWITFPTPGHMITQGRDGHVKIWTYDGTVWKHSGSLKSSSLGFCSGTLLSTNCSILAVPSERTSQVDLYDIDNRQLIGQLKPEDGDTKYGTPMSIKAVGSDSDQQEILIGYEDGSITLWDIRNFKMASRLECHDESVMCMCYSKVSNKGLSASVDCKVQSWKILNNETLEQGQSATLTNPGINDIVIRDDQKILATAGWDSNVRIFGLKKLSPLAVLSYHKESVQCVTFSSDNLLACGSKDKLISLWTIY